jgi:hypothetical protein
MMVITENLIDGRNDLSMTFRYLAATLCLLAVGILYVLMFRTLRYIAIELRLISRSDGAHLRPLLSSWPDAWYDEADKSCVRRDGG